MKGFSKIIRESVRKVLLESEQDDLYLKAYQENDIETAKTLVENAANAAMSSTRITGSDGKPLEVFHGTYWNPMKEKMGKAAFDNSMRGTGSGDNGFFGNGFYFALDSREAMFYGGNVFGFYLNIKNPFDYFQEMRSVSGMSAENQDLGRNAAATYNMGRKFSSLFSDVTIDVVKWWYDEDECETKFDCREISLKEFADTVDRLLSTLDFRQEKTEHPWGNYGDYTKITCNPKKYRTEAGYEWEENEYEEIWYGKTGSFSKLDLVIDYWQKVGVDGYKLGELPDTRVVFQNYDISGELVRMGYDGVNAGDEIVAFYPQQIKSSEPFVFDDSGKLIPLSQRFDFTKNDIRY